MKKTQYCSVCGKGPFGNVRNHRPYCSSQRKDVYEEFSSKVMAIIKSKDGFTRMSDLMKQVDMDYVPWEKYLRRMERAEKIDMQTHGRPSEIADEKYKIVDKYRGTIFYIMKGRKG